MKYDKIYLRNRSLLQRKKKYLKAEKFNFNLIFRLIKKHFQSKKITIELLSSLKDITELSLLMIL